MISHTAPGVHRLLHHVCNLFEVRYVSAVRHCITAGSLDFGDHGSGIGRLPIVITKIVDEDFGAALSQCKGMTAPESLARARDDGHLAVKSDTHFLIPLSR